MASLDIFNASDVSAPGHYPPSQTALLLLDFHTMFVQGDNAIGSAPAQVAADLRTWAHSHNITVIHALVDVHGTPYTTIKGLPRLSPLLTALRAEGGGGQELTLLRENLAEGEATFSRTPGFVSALKSPGIEEFLREKGIKSLILAGLSTSGCVLRTAIPATDAEYVVTVISDGCADRDEEVHKLVLEKILPTRAYVLTAAEFTKGYAQVISRT
jgi:nicotinamidase-related amidase